MAKHGAKPTEADQTAAALRADAAERVFTQTTVTRWKMEHAAEPLHHAAAFATGHGPTGLQGAKSSTEQ